MALLAEPEATSHLGFDVKDRVSEIKFFTSKLLLNNLVFEERNGESGRVDALQNSIFSFCRELLQLLTAREVTKPSAAAIVKQLGVIF